MVIVVILWAIRRRVVNKRVKSVESLAVEQNLIRAMGMRLSPAQ